VNTVMFHKMLQNFRLPEQLAASQEGLSFIELVGWLDRHLYILLRELRDKSFILSGLQNSTFYNMK
jgi:hypothetical protein